MMYSAASHHTTRTKRLELETQSLLPLQLYIIQGPACTVHIHTPPTIMGPLLLLSHVMPEPECHESSVALQGTGRSWTVGTWNTNVATLVALAAVHDGSSALLDHAWDLTVRVLCRPEAHVLAGSVAMALEHVMDEACADGAQQLDAMVALLWSVSFATVGAEVVTHIGRGLPVDHYLMVRNWTFLDREVSTPAMARSVLLGLTTNRTGSCPMCIMYVLDAVITMAAATDATMYVDTVRRAVSTLFLCGWVRHDILRQCMCIAKKLVAVHSRTPEMEVLRVQVAAILCIMKGGGSSSKTRNRRQRRKRNNARKQKMATKGRPGFANAVKCGDKRVHPSMSAMNEKQRRAVLKILDVGDKEVHEYLRTPGAKDVYMWCGVKHKF